MACFADINVSQGSVATYTRCGGIFSMHLTGNLPRNLSVKKILNWLRFDRIMVMSLWPRFLAHPPYTLTHHLIFRYLHFSNCYICCFCVSTIAKPMAVHFIKRKKNWIVTRRRQVVTLVEPVTHISMAYPVYFSLMHIAENLKVV